jgi:hypothetical protein
MWQGQSISISGIRQYPLMQRGGEEEAQPVTVYCTPPEAGSDVRSMIKGKKKIHNGPNPSAEGALAMAISDCIHSLGLQFSVASHLKFRKLIHLAKAVGSGYKPLEGTRLQVHYSN